MTDTVDLVERARTFARGDFGGWPDEWIMKLVGELATALEASQSEATALRVERDGARAELEWPWAFPPIDMADASVLAIRNWNYEGVADERLIEEVEALRLNLGHIRREMKASEAREAALLERVGELEKGLEPFEDVSGEGDEDFPDTAPTQVHFGRTTHYTLTLGDFRRAAQLLKDNPA